VVFDPRKSEGTYPAERFRKEIEASTELRATPLHLASPATEREAEIGASGV
jgi:hypothetical protein